MEGIPRIHTLSIYHNQLRSKIQIMGEEIKRMDSFRLLLNEISRHLTDQNLQSLIHIFDVPGSEKNKMNSGLQLFDYMIKQDFISRKRIANVRYLMRKIRRKDLVGLVDDYINKEFQPDEIRSIHKDFEDSWEKDSQNQHGSPITEPEEPALNLNCTCRGGVRMPSCYMVVVVFLLLSITATVAFWFGHIARVSRAIKSDADIKNTGTSILGVEIFLLLLVPGLCFRKKIASCLFDQNSGYTELTNQSVNHIQAGSSQSILGHASTVRSQSETDSAVFASSEVLPNSSGPEA